MAALLWKAVDKNAVDLFSRCDAAGLSLNLKQENQNILDCITAGVLMHISNSTGFQILCHTDGYFD